MFERNLPAKLSKPGLRQHPVFPVATELLLFSMPLAYFSIYFPIKPSMLFIKILNFLADFVFVIISNTQHHTAVKS